MSGGWWLHASERLVRGVMRLYPADFRDEMGESVVEAYRDAARDAYDAGGPFALGGVWLRVLTDSLRNGIGERLRPAVTWRRGGHWGRDAERVVRRLVRAPAFTLSMVATLTVGLGGFAVVYAVVDKVLFEPLPYEAPDDLYYVWRHYEWLGLERGWLGGPDVAALRAAGGTIEDAAALRRQRVTLGGDPAVDPVEVALLEVTPNLFELLGTRPLLGRDFSPHEAGPGRPPVVVLGHDLWTTRFGADPAVVNSEIRLNGEPYTVIGIMGRDFRFAAHSSLGPPEGADLYATFDYHLAEVDPFQGSWAGLIRARPGSGSEAVAQAVAAVGRLVDRRDFQGLGLRLYPVGVKSDLVARVRPALVVLGLAAIFLVLVLMVNLSTLLLTRAAQREREFAIARALGANGIARFRATLLEGGVLGLLGGAGGALAAIWGTRVLQTLAPLELPRREQIGVDGGVATVVIAIGALLGLLAATVPAAWAARARLGALLGEASVRGGGGRARWRRSMVVVQVALSLILLGAGGLVVRSFEQLLRADPGFDAAGILTFRVHVPPGRYPNPESVRSLHDRIHNELLALPGVHAAGAASALPLSAGASQTTVLLPGAPGNTGESDHDAPLIDHVGVRSGYFETLGIEFLTGRGFDAGRLGAGEAIVDRTLAATFFPTGDPIGATLVFAGDSLVVVGVVEQVRQYDVHSDGRPQVYLPADGRRYSTLSWALRTERPPLTLVSEARAAVRRVDPELAVADLRTGEQLVAESIGQQRLSAALIASFAVGALLLAAMGLFGIVSGSVTRRRHEIAIRLALGAERGEVMRLVVGEGARLVVLGLALGAPGLALSARAVRGVVVGVSPYDPATLATIAVALVVVALVACYIPSRRVASIEPAQALKQE